MGRVSLNKYLGCLVGGAIGDALGAPIEFDDIEQIRANHGISGVSEFVEFPENIGEFTDDTQMTLFTAEGLLRAEHRAMLKGIGGALNQIVHQSYLRWLHTQENPFYSETNASDMQDLGEGWLLKQKALYKRRAPGNTCLTALRSGIEGTIQNPINDSKGCGTIMRVAPVGLVFYGNNELSFEIACELSAITHGHPSGYLSAGFFASIISDLAIGTNLDNCIQNALDILVTYDHHEETLEAVKKSLHQYDSIANTGAYPDTEMIENLGAGWIAEEALSISIFSSLVYKEDYRKGVLYAVNHGGDSDSTGSITGNILGLINGLESIPKKWRNKLMHCEIVKQVGADLYSQVKGDHYNTDEAWWTKYPGY
jgi:ADP-ribosylglycohydrolase